MHRRDYEQILEKGVELGLGPEDWAKILLILKSFSNFNAEKFMKALKKKISPFDYREVEKALLRYENEHRLE